MRYKHFKNADVDASVLAVGTWAIGGQGYGDVNEKDSVAAIQAMFDGGVNLIDTAPAYGAGYSETVCAKALKGYDRSKILVSTKCAIATTTAKYKRHPQPDMVRDGSYANILYECEQSLRRLETDYIDFLFVHWPDYDTPFAETMEAMNQLKKEGKVRFVGLSNFNEEQITECQKYGVIDAVQPPYSMVNERDKGLMEWCRDRGIGSFTYGSLGSGILTGAIRELPKWDPDDFRYTFYDFYKEPKFSKCMELLKVLDKIAAEKNKPLAQIAINWSTQKDYVGTALCGVRNVKEAEENCATFDWTLTDDEMATIDQALATLDI